MQIEKKKKTVLKEQTITSTSCLSFCILLFPNNLKKTLFNDLHLNVVLIFKESGFQIFLTRQLPHAHYHLRISNPITLSGIRLSNLAPVRNVETYNSWLLPHITIQPHQCGSLITYNSRLHHIPQSQRRHLQSHHKSIWVSSSACPHQGHGQSNEDFFLPEQYLKLGKYLEY